MFLPLYFQIPIFFLLLVAARQDYLTRRVSNDVIGYIAIFSIPLILNQTEFLIPISLCILFLVLFYLPEKIGKYDLSIVANSIGGADTKVFIPLLLSMSTNEIFIFFLLFTIPNIYFLIRLRDGIPLFISILFGYFGIIVLSLLPILIRITFAS
jgi:Flp pilus assembly protein protease CpaA